MAHLMQPCKKQKLECMLKYVKQFVRNNFNTYNYHLESYHDGLMVLGIKSYKCGVKKTPFILSPLMLTTVKLHVKKIIYENV
jgi:hypothetical protein